MTEVGADAGFEFRFAKDVRDSENSWLEQGIHGVSAIIFNRRHRVTDAQEVEHYRNSLQRKVTERSVTARGMPPLKLHPMFIRNRGARVRGCPEYA